MKKQFFLIVLACIMAMISMVFFGLYFFQNAMSQPIETTISPVITQPTTALTNPTNEPTAPTTQPTTAPPTHAHSYASVVTAPTCTQVGYTTYLCACGHTYTDSETAATGHSWRDWITVQEPTEEAEGTARRTCTNCEATEENTLPKLEHIHRHEAAVTAPTCTQVGYTTYFCACGHTYTDSETAATGHSWGDWITVQEPTEEAEGTARRTCANCEATEENTLPKLEHIHRYEAAVTAPTCTQVGYTTYLCACGHTYTDSETAATGHSWGNWITTQAPTTDAEGKQMRSCTICEATEEAVLDKLPEEPPVTISITAKQAFVYDLSSDAFLFTHGDLAQAIEPASITKLFAAYVGLQYLPEDMLLTVGEEVNWIDPQSSRAYIYKGHKLTVKQCVQGMIIPSGNDAAYVLAVNAGKAISGDPNISVRDAFDCFMVEMNRQVQQLGMINTHFVNPDGMTAPEHYTCMHDLLIIAKLSLENPIILDAAQTQRMRANFPSGHFAEWTNSNLLLDPKSTYYCADAFGLKTGSTSSAGKCLLSTFRQGDRILIVCVMGSSTNATRYEDTLSLYQAFQ